LTSVVRLCFLAVITEHSHPHRLRQLPKVVTTQRDLIRKLAEQTSSVIFEYDIATDVSRWYGDTTAVFGYPRKHLDTVGAKGWDELVHPEDRAMTRAAYASASRTGEPFTIEYRFQHAAGYYVHIEENAAVTLDETGRAARSMGTIRDVTGRRTAILALAESEERFRATFDQAAGGIHHVSPEGGYLRINRRFCEMVGYTRTELEARHFKDITHPDDLDADLDHVQRLLDGVSPTYTMEKRYIRKDGSFLWVNLTVSLVRNAAGEPDYFVSIIEDITDRVRAEGALQQHQQALEAKNIVLRELLNRGDAEKRQLQQVIHDNFERTVTPLVQRLRQSSESHNRKLVEQLDEQLQQILSPLVRQLATEFVGLSPREIEVCALIRNGLNSKEIADNLRISLETVHKFRHQIRRKLRITNQQVNLRSYLRLLERRGRG
jgi:two-component system sensor histidine kinase UhpB